MASATDETGSGATSALAGVAAFLAFLLLAVQVLIHLYATSMVSAAAFDAARLASAEASAGPAVARTHGLALLGDYGRRVRSFDITVGADDVVVRVRAASPALVPVALARVLSADSIDRTVTMRRERQR